MNYRNFRLEKNDGAQGWIEIHTSYTYKSGSYKVHMIE
ncbi:hypothetical protein PJE062_3976 [Pseudovibrio sp. JE062]|nr:hypothetical protein PJE062_3976 [Pseudovibrio sp. JE062]